MNDKTLQQPTAETDACPVYLYAAGDDIVNVKELVEIEHARKLERERDEALKTIGNMHNWIRVAEAHLNALRCLMGVPMVGSDAECVVLGKTQIP